MSQPTCSSSDTESIDISSQPKEMTFLEHITKVSKERREQHSAKIREFAAEYYFKFMNYILPTALAYPEATNGLCEKESESYRFFHPVNPSGATSITFNDESGNEYLKMDVTRSVHDLVVDSIGKNEGIKAERAIAKIGTEEDSPSLEGILVRVSIEGKTFTPGDDVGANPRGFILHTADHLRKQILDNIDKISDALYLKVVEIVVPLMIEFPENYPNLVSQDDEKYYVVVKLDSEVPVKLRFKKSDDQSDDEAFSMSVNIAEEVHNRLSGRLGMLRGVLCKRDTLDGEGVIALTIMKN